MQANWKTQGAQRRRRILIDEAVASDASAVAGNRKPCVASEAGSGDERAGRSYEPAALDNQPRITDLVPRSPWLLALLMFVWLLLVSGITCLHLQLGQSAAHRPGGLAPFDFAGDAGLATWFASATLFLAAIGSLQVFVVRRHKTDDYRGTYRLWFWAAAWLVLASVEVTAEMRGLLREAAVHLSWAGEVSGDLWWMLLIGLPSLAIGVRLAIEMGASKGAVVLAAAAGVAYLYAGVFHLGYVSADPNLTTVHCVTAMLSAHSLVLATVAVYARHVVLEARGQLTQKVKKQKPERIGKEQDVAEVTRKAETVTKPKARQPAKTKPKPRKTASNATAAKASKTKQPAAADTQPKVKRPAVAEETAEDTPASSPNESRKSRRRKQPKQQQQAQQREAKKPEPGKAAPAPQVPAQEKPEPPKHATSESEPVPDFEEISDEQRQFRGLTKSERRKMRKLRRSQVRRAA